MVRIEQAEMGFEYGPTRVQPYGALLTGLLQPYGGIQNPGVHGNLRQIPNYRNLLACGAAYHAKNTSPAVIRIYTPKLLAHEIHFALLKLQYRFKYFVSSDLGV